MNGLASTLASTMTAVARLARMPWWLAHTGQKGSEMNARFLRRLTGALLALLVLAGCTALQPAAAPAAPAAPPALLATAKNSDGYADISVDQLAAALPDKRFTLVNVHIPYEGELPQTDLFVPFNEVGAYLDELPAKDAPIVLYCRSGSMSTQAAEALVAAGYTQVYEVDGGFNAWVAAGNELLSK
jgi:rhodanese-related sulfurtransferase